MPSGVKIIAPKAARTPARRVVAPPSNRARRSNDDWSIGSPSGIRDFPGIASRTTAAGIATSAGVPPSQVTTGCPGSQENTTTGTGVLFRKKQHYQDMVICDFYRYPHLPGRSGRHRFRPGAEPFPDLTRSCVAIHGPRMEQGSPRGTTPCLARYRPKTLGAGFTKNPRSSGDVDPAATSTTNAEPVTD
jgi:hypothetical protein